MVAPPPFPSADELARMSVAELAQGYVASIRAAETTGHVRRQNRLIGFSSTLARELKARGEAHSVFQQLADHPDPDVSRWAKSEFGRLDKPDWEGRPEPPPRSLRAEFAWQCDHPPPPALPRDEIAARLRQRVPKLADRLVELAVPTIGLWPQRRAEVPALASRFGGMPVAPPDWHWPIVQEEPLLFVGQINCSEMHGLPGAEVLPAAGLLAFFGNYEALVGAFPFGDHCVFYWPDAAKLAAPAMVIEPLKVFPTCALVPRPIVDLPHPHSRVVRELGINEQLRKAYFDVWMDVREHGIPSDCVGYAGFSKMFGWPDLLQNDLMEFAPDKGDRLLLQVDKYCDGEEAHDWGPGGTLFYYLSASELKAGRFARCCLEGQFT